jgi:dipeptidyl-peptidase-4
MKRFSIIWLLGLYSLSGLAARQALSLDSIVAGCYQPLKEPAFYPMADPALYAAVDEGGTRINSYEFRTGKVRSIILDLQTAKGPSLKQIKGFVLNPQETWMLFWTDQTPVYRHSFLTTYYLYDIRHNRIQPLSEKGDNQRDARFSPDGRSVSFARDNNLFIKRLDFGTEIQVTTDGVVNGILNGIADWVYEEEFG